MTHHRPEWFNTEHVGNTYDVTGVIQTHMNITKQTVSQMGDHWHTVSLSGVPDYFGRNKISSGGDLSHYSSASLY